MYTYQSQLNTVHTSLDCLLHKLFLKLVCAALRCMTLGFDGQEGSLHWKSLPGKTVPSSSPERKAHMWSAILLWIWAQPVCVFASTWEVNTNMVCVLLHQHARVFSHKVTTATVSLVKYLKKRLLQCVRKKVFRLQIWNCVRTFIFQNSYLYKWKHNGISDQDYLRPIKRFSQTIEGKVWSHTGFTKTTVNSLITLLTLILLEIHSSNSIPIAF